MSSVVCLITPGQPSTNPRLLKEADALVEAGHAVHVVCAHWADWADDTDRQLLAGRRFTCTYVGGRRRQSATYQWTRFRHRATRELHRWKLAGQAPTWALSRVTPELRRAASRVRADLYIAHNLGALPAAWSSARANGARLGFDAEDLHSAASDSMTASFDARLARTFELALIPECDYVTASAPLVAERYAALCDIPLPSVVLNVFPLEDRPSRFRQTSTGRVSLYWFSQTIGADRGLEDVVDAMGLLRASDFVLHLQGRWQDGYEGVLRKRMATSGLRQNQLIHHPPEEPDSLTRRASLYDIGLAVEPGRDENNRIVLSNKLFTYLLAGSAVLATSTPGQEPIVRSLGRAGRLYEPGDVQTLAAHLTRWHDDRSSLEASRVAAWRAAEETFNWNREKLVFLRAVDGVLRLRRPREFGVNAPRASRNPATGRTPGAGTDGVP